MRLQFDEAADRRRRVLADGQPHALRLFGETARVKRLDSDRDAIAALAAFADFDKAGKVGRRDWTLQHRMRNPHGLCGGDGESGGDRRNAEREWKCNRAVTNSKGERSRCKRGKRNRT